MNNYKRILFTVFKFIIVIGACYFIVQKLIRNQQLSLDQFQEQLATLFSKSQWQLLILLLFSIINWVLEMFKWKTLVSTEKEISFFEATKQCLASLTVSIITPNRIGEYGAKALFFEKKKRKKIMLLNLIGNLSLLATTVLFGCIGIIFLLYHFKISIPQINIGNSLIITFFVIILILFRKKLQLYKFKQKLQQIPKLIYAKTFCISFIRYIIFSHQFYFLTLLFDTETSYFVIINLVSCMYFLASIIPSLSIFDWAIKGSIAVWLFGFVNLNELTIITIATCMWVLNFAIPSLIGSIFVLNFKTFKSK